MRIATPPALALTAAALLAVSGCHPSDQTQPGTFNGTTPTSNAGGAPGTATNTSGVATPNGTPATALPTDPNAASAAAGEALVPASAASSGTR